MLTIHYSQVCDVCGIPVNDETFQFNLCKPDAYSNLPLPDYPYVVNEMQVCHGCLNAAMEPLRFKLGQKK